MKKTSNYNSIVYEELFSLSKVPMLVIDSKTGEILESNNAGLRFFSFNKKRDLSHHNLSDFFFVNPEDLLKEIHEQLAMGENQVSFQQKLPTGDQTSLELKINVLEACDSILLTLVESQADKESFEARYLKERSQFQLLFDNSREAVAILDEDYKVLKINSAFEDLFQYTISEVENKDITKLICNQAQEKTSYRLRDRVSQGVSVGEELKRQRKDGSLVDVSLKAFPLEMEGVPFKVYSVFTDLSKTKKQEEEIRSLTHKDQLTGLFNKAFFLEKLKHELIEKSAYPKLHSELAILVINLNESKELNDALGYAIGDLIFKEFSFRLKKLVKEDYTIARLNKENVAVMIPRLESQEELQDLADAAIHRLKNVFYISGYNLNITSNIGISIHPKDGDDGETLIRKAEIALYKSKEIKANSVLSFEPSFDEEIQESFWIKTDLEQAFSKRELYLNYQPIYNILTNKVVGVESLLRWKHPEHGLVSPSKFVPIAEHMGLIDTMGEWVLLEACKQAKKWQKQGYPRLKLSVNVSILQLEEANFTDILQNALRLSGLDPRYLQLEVTETVLTQNYDKVKETLEQVAKLGVNFSIDDFGSGYSSLGQLSELSFNNIKIDKSLIDDVNHFPGKAKIVKMIINLADSLDVTFIAEGVETQAELNFLKENKCTLVQGYYFSKPLASDAFEKLLIKQKASL